MASWVSGTKTPSPSLKQAARTSPQVVGDAGGSGGGVGRPTVLDSRGDNALLVRHQEDQVEVSE
jgi:hypothetical protein